MLFGCDIVLTLFLCCLAVCNHNHFSCSFHEAWDNTCWQCSCDCPMVRYIHLYYGVLLYQFYLVCVWGGGGGVGRDWGVSEWEMYKNTNLWWVRELRTTHSVTWLNLERKWALSRLAVKLQFSLSLAVPLTTPPTLLHSLLSPLLLLCVCMYACVMIGSVWVHTTVVRHCNAELLFC